MERELTITELRGVFTKDYDTFGKMDPFVQFIVGKQSTKTETAHKGGKEPKWTTPIVLKFYEQQDTIVVKGWQQDTTTNDYMGQGKIDIKSLKANGTIQVKIIEDNNTQSGTIYGKYQLKNLAPAPVLTVRNIKCDFYTDTDFIIKSKPFISINHNGVKQQSQNKDKGDRQIAWNESLRIKLKDGEKITFSMEDKLDKTNIIFVYDALPKEFRTTSGKKRFNVMDKKFQPFGVLQFEYDTQNFVNKDQSAKNQEAAKKQTEQLTQISIQSIKGNLSKESNDLYFKIVAGSNFIKTNLMEKAKKDFDLNVNTILYAEKSQNKITFAAYNEENIGGDSFYGSGQLWIQNLAQGKNTVKLQDRRGKSFGQINVNLKTKSVISKQFSLTDVKVKVSISADFIGDSDIYVIGSIGGWTSRTETLSGNQVAFTKNINLKFSEQKIVNFSIMDQDVTKDESMYEVTANLQQLSETGQMSIPLIPQKYKDDKSKHGVLSFKYKTKNVAKPPAPVKKEEPVVKKEEPKKEQPKKEQPKKQQIKKQQPKKQEIKKQQPPKKQQIKKEEPKKQQIKKEQQKQQSPKKQEVKKYQPPKKQQQQKKQQKKLEESIIKQKSLDKSKLQKSRNTIKLPNINEPKNYGDRIYDKQSSSTLQKSIVVYSMPKANRFGNGPKYTGEPTFVMESCFKTNSGKGAGFGFGNKRQFPQWLEKNMKQNPAPGSYFDHPKTSEQYRAKGPTFGLPYKYYEKVTIPRQKFAQIREQRKSPQKVSLRKI